MSVEAQIMAWARQRPEWRPIRPRDLRHIGKPSTVRTALSRLTRREDLLRICRGIYVRSVTSTYGRPLSSLEYHVVQALAREWGDVIATTGASAANALGLSTQVPMRSVYWTTGRDRMLYFGKRPVELRRVPAWQMTAAHTEAGYRLRALVALWRPAAEIEAALAVARQDGAAER